MGDKGSTSSPTPLSLSGYCSPHRAFARLKEKVLGVLHIHLGKEDELSLQAYWRIVLRIIIGVATIYTASGVRCSSPNKKFKEKKNLF